MGREDFPDIARTNGSGTQIEFRARLGGTTGNASQTTDERKAEERRNISDSAAV